MPFPQRLCDKTEGLGQEDRERGPQEYVGPCSPQPHRALSPRHEGPGGCRAVPQNSVGARGGDGVWSRALAQPVQFTDGDVQAEEELQDLLGEGRGPADEGVAVLQAQRGPDLREHQGLCHAVVYGHVPFPGKRTAGRAAADGRPRPTAPLTSPQALPTPAAAWC